MSLADAALFHALEARVARLEARLGAEATEGAAGAPGPVPAAQRIAEDPLMASVIDALRTGQSIRGAAQALGLDRNKVARMREQAITEGRLTRVSPVSPV